MTEEFSFGPTKVSVSDACCYKTDEEVEMALRRINAIATKYAIEKGESGEGQ